LDRCDICDMLNGHNILSLDTDELEKVDIQEIIGGLLLHHEQIRKHGRDEYIEKLQHAGGFSSFKDELSGLVSGFDTDPLKIHKMPEKALRTWIINYLEMLSRERRKAEKTTVFKGYHGGF
jgi:hypothetical protein